MLSYIVHGFPWHSRAVETCSLEWRITLHLAIWYMSLGLVVARRTLPILLYCSRCIVGGGKILVCGCFSGKSLAHSFLVKATLNTILCSIVWPHTVRKWRYTSEQRKVHTDMDGCTSTRCTRPWLAYRATNQLWNELQEKPACTEPATSASQWHFWKNGHYFS